MKPSEFLIMRFMACQNIHDDSSDFSQKIMMALNVASVEIYYSYYSKLFIRDLANWAMSNFKLSQKYEIFYNEKITGTRAYLTPALGGAE